MRHSIRPQFSIRIERTALLFRKGILRDSILHRPVKAYKQRIAAPGIVHAASVLDSDADESVGHARRLTKAVRDNFGRVTMKPVYEEFLIRTYPTIYQSLEQCFPGGERFECGDGWYSIVEERSEGLEAIARVRGVNRLNVVQVKEKSAAVRVYFDRPASEMAIAFVDAAIERSRVTCELCGASGELRRYREGWLRTLCERCATQAQTAAHA